MTASQRKAIFGICKKLGMSDDDRRALVLGVTGKESTKELTDRETEDVLKELRKRLDSETVPPEKRNPKAYKPAEAGMMTTDQQSLAWRLMYRLCELDEKPMLHEDGTPVTPGERMAGAIRAILDNNMAKPGKEIFDRVHFDEGMKLIEKLKMYVHTAEKRAKRRENNEDRR